MVGEPTFPGCLIECRAVGMFCMKDERGPDEKIRCMPAHGPRYAYVQDTRGIPAFDELEITYFFETRRTSRSARAPKDRTGRASSSGFPRLAEVLAPGSCPWESTFSSVPVPRLSVVPSSPAAGKSHPRARGTLSGATVSLPRGVRTGGGHRGVGLWPAERQAATGVRSAVRCSVVRGPWRRVNSRSRPRAPEPVNTSRNMAQQYMAAPSPLFWSGHRASGWCTLK
ncbi:Inorganic pyrophosphatase [Streptomyces hirsutus]